jgi:hypothetical protein
MKRRNNPVAKSRPLGKYAEKRRAGKQMYSSPGFTCCGHTRKSQIFTRHKER